MAATDIASAELPASRAAGIGLAVVAMATIQLGAALSEPLFDRSAPRASWPSGWRWPR